MYIGDAHRLQTLFSVYEANSRISIQRRKRRRLGSATNCRRCDEETGRFVLSFARTFVAEDGHAQQPQPVHELVRTFGAFAAG